MAYFPSSKKQELSPGVKAVLKKYGVKGSLSVAHLSTFVVTLTSGPFDFERKDGSEVNHYWIEKFYPNAVDFLTELKKAMMVGNHDNSDSMTDYFDVGFYISIRVGRWDKPYVCTSV